MKNLGILASLFLLIAHNSVGQEIVNVYESEQTTLEWDYKDHNTYYFSCLPNEIITKVRELLLENDIAQIDEEVYDSKVSWIRRIRRLSFVAKFHKLFPLGCIIFFNGFEYGTEETIKAYIANSNIHHLGNGRTSEVPLVIATKSNQINAVNLLLAAGANPNHGDKPVFPSDRIFPLQIAAEKGFAEIACLLIDAGAQVDVTHNNTWPPLCIAAKYGHEGVVRLLLEKGAQINDVNKEWRWSALSLATYGQHWDIVKLLVSKGADVNLGDEYAGYPLQWTIKAGNEEMVTFLLEAGARTEQIKYNFSCPKKKYVAIKQILDRYN